MCCRSVSAFLDFLVRFDFCVVFAVKFYIIFE